MSRKLNNHSTIIAGLFTDDDEDNTGEYPAEYYLVVNTRTCDIQSPSQVVDASAQQGVQLVFDGFNNLTDVNNLDITTIWKDWNTISNQN